MKKTILIVLAICGLVVASVPVQVSAADAQKPGTCFVLVPGDNEPTTRPCNSSDKALIKKDGLTFSSKKCYSITATTSTANASETDCSGEGHAGTEVQGGGGTDASGVVLDNPVKTGDTCGGGDHNDHVDVSVNIGCTGKGNPIVDMLFALIRFLSNGVGLVIIASIIYGGIQYTTSRGDPQATANAINRIRNSLFALLLFVFAYALLNFLIPKGFLQ
jgi:hypothetical protein